MEDINKLFSFLREKLSDGEERENLINKLLNESSQLQLAAFKNSATGEILTLGEFIEREGRDKAKELIGNLLDSIANGDGIIEKQAISTDEFKKIHEKVLAGTANEDEKVVHDMIMQNLKASESPMENSQKLITLLMNTMVDVTRFCNEDVCYDAPLSDFVVTLDLYTTAALALNPNTALHKFVGCEPDTFTNIGKTVCNDIMQACVDFWAKKGSTPKPEFIILGLLNYLMALCSEFHIPNFKDVKSFFNFVDDDEAAEEEKPEVVQPICHGSNNKVVPFTAAEAKDLLKDD